MALAEDLRFPDDVEGETVEEVEGEALAKGDAEPLVTGELRCFFKLHLRGIDTS